MFGRCSNLALSSIRSDEHSGRPCFLMSHIPTQSGGAWNEMTGYSFNSNEHIYLSNIYHSAEGESDDGNCV